MLKYVWWQVIDQIQSVTYVCLCCVFEGVTRPQWTSLTRCPKALLGTYGRVSARLRAPRRNQALKGRPPYSDNSEGFGYQSLHRYWLFKDTIKNSASKGREHLQMLKQSSGRGLLLKQFRVRGAALADFPQSRLTQYLLPASLISSHP